VRELIHDKLNHIWKCSDCAWRWWVPRSPLPDADYHQLIEQMSELRDKTFGAHSCRNFPGKPIKKKNKP
jgi:hypothetical protein